MRVSQETPNKVVVRPIAFKPVVPTKRGGYSPEHTSFTPISHDDGYSSRDLSSRACSQSTSTMSRDSDTYSSPFQNRGHHDCHTIPILDESSSSVERDIDALIQDKEAEMAKLRRTMELNESAIIRVHEQKRIEWENQMKELAQEYHRRLRIQQDHSQDRESELRQLMAKLEIDNRQLSVDIQQKHVDQDRQKQLTIQVQELKQRNADLSQKLTTETCECDLLRQKNKEMDSEIRKFEHRLSTGEAEQQRLKDQIRDMDNNHSKRNQGNKLSQLQQKLDRQEQHIKQERERFRAEQEKWKDEKEKVIQYQKQLQRSYVQMYRRNNELEQQLCRINSRRNARLDSPTSLNSTEKNSFYSIDLDNSPESFC